MLISPEHLEHEEGNEVALAGGIDGSGDRNGFPGKDGDQLADEAHQHHGDQDDSLRFGNRDGELLQEAEGLPHGLGQGVHDNQLGHEAGQRHQQEIGYLRSNAGVGYGVGSGTVLHLGEAAQHGVGPEQGRGFQLFAG